MQLKSIEYQNDIINSLKNNIKCKFETINLLSNKYSHNTILGTLNEFKGGGLNLNKKIKNIDENPGKPGNETIKNTDEVSNLAKKFRDSLDKKIQNSKKEQEKNKTLTEKFNELNQEKEKQTKEKENLDSLIKNLKKT